MDDSAPEGAPPAARRAGVPAPPTPAARRTTALPPLRPTRPRTLIQKVEPKIKTLPAAPATSFSLAAQPPPIRCWRLSPPPRSTRLPAHSRPTPATAGGPLVDGGRGPRPPAATAARPSAAISAAPPASPTSYSATPASAAAAPPPSASVDTPGAAAVPPVRPPRRRRPGSPGDGALPPGTAAGTRPGYRPFGPPVRAAQAGHPEAGPVARPGARPGGPPGRPAPGGARIPPLCRRWTTPAGGPRAVQVGPGHPLPAASSPGSSKRGDQRGPDSDKKKAKKGRKTTIEIQTADIRSLRGSLVEIEDVVDQSVVPAGLARGAHADGA